MQIVKVFYDTETTGTNHKKHSIHNLAGIIEVDGVIVEEFDIFMRPHEKAELDPKALTICNVTKEQLEAYPDFKKGKKHFTDLLSRYINRYDPKQKAYLVGFNNAKFDDLFLRYLFELCGDTFYNAWFYSDSQDAMILASRYLEDRRPEMPSFKLHRVARTLGITFDEKGLHGALFDSKLTRLIYRIVTGIDLEI